MILNEFDAYQAALRKINLNEEAMPVYNGKILTENVDTYCKIQKLLACNRFEGAHRWLYDLDIENLDESEINKVCNLYNLGVERKLITDDDKNEETSDETAEKTDECDLMSGKMDQITIVKDPAPVMPDIKPTPEMPTSAYTVVYSAMRDGELKTGEAYSNSLNTRSAKADIISKLEKAGYQNITILAIEAGDPDMTGCDNTFCKQAEIPTYEDEAAVNEEDEETSDDSAEEEKDDSEDNSEEDADSKEDNSSDDEDKKEEDAEEPDEKIKDDAKEEDGKEDASDDKEEDELSDQEKIQLKDSYKKAFKATMQKCKYFDKSFNDLTLEEKVKFFETINAAWKDKADPSKFMTDKELETLEKVVVKK